MHLVILTFISLLSTSVIFCQNDDSNKTVETTLSPDVPSTTITIDNTTCSQNSGDCKKCLENKDQCFYCETNKECHAFAMEALLPDDKCPIKQRNIGTCAMNLMVVMILVGVAVGIVIIGIICCCCCCCRRDGKIKLSKDDLKWARQREERKARSEEKRQERAARTEDIRRKYGLFKDDTPYQRFEA